MTASAIGSSSSSSSSSAVGTENDGIKLVGVRKTNAAEELMKTHGINLDKSR